MNLPRLRLLDRFFLIRFAGAFLVFFLLFTSLFILAELFDLRDSTTFDRAMWRTVTLYLSLRIPFLAYASAPISVILASIVVFATRAHLSEIVAAQAGGISVLRLAASITAVSSGVAVLLLLGTEFKIPRWSDRADYIRRVEIQKKLPPRTEFRDLVFQTDSLYVMTDLFVPVENRMKRVTILRPNADHTTLVGVASYEELRYDRVRGWRDPAKEKSDPVPLPVPKIVELIAASGGVKLLSDKPMEAVSISSLAHEIVDLESLGDRGSYEKLDDEIYERYARVSAKLAFPFSVPFLAVLGAGLGSRVGRRRGIGAAVGNALLCTLGYMILVQTAAQLSELAAHAPSLRSGAAAIPWAVPAIIGSLSGYSLRS